MINRVVIQYVENVNNQNTKKDGFRIYIKDGIVQNKGIEELVVASLDLLTANRIRQTGKGNRNLYSILE